MVSPEGIGGSMSDPGLPVAWRLISSHQLFSVPIVPALLSPSSRLQPPRLPFEVAEETDPIPPSAQSPWSLLPPPTG